MNLRRLSFVCLVLLAAGVNAEPPRSEPIDIGSRREPLVDGFLIQSVSGASQMLREPVRRELAITHDQPWEGNCCAYHTVFQDGDLYRMYYRSTQSGTSTAGIAAHPSVVCYAESKDGIHWTKPELGLFEFLGSKKNNIVRLEPTPEGFAVFKDANPACAKEQRYKALTAVKGGLVALASPDGLRWSKLDEKPVITKGAFDSMNLAFWDSTRQRYVEFHRHFRNGLRDIMTSTSSDFLHWTEPEWLEYPGAAREQLYTNGVVPYPGAEHLFVGFPARYMATRPSPFVPYKGVTAAMNGITDALFMTSRDGLQFHRWAEAFIRPGLQSDCWVTRNNYPAWGIVTTKSDTPEGGPEFSLYATEGYYRGGPCRLRRFTTRIDGFVSIHATSQGGEMLTRPLIFSGKTMKINYSTSAAGSVRIEIQDAAGNPLPGFALADCPEIFGDELASVVQWKTGSDVSSLHGKPVRLRIALKDADLFAIQFHD